MRSLTTPEQMGRVVQRALDLGINHFETAQGYGQSEVYLGQALGQRAEGNRAELTVTTKITPQSNAPAMAQAIDRSLARLGLEHIDCLAIHGINTPAHLAQIQDTQGCMQAVREAIAADKVGHVGFSTHGPLEIVLAAIETGQFSFVNLHYTYFFQRNAPAIALAQQQDLGIFIISPADKGGLLYTPPPSLIQNCAPLDPLHLNARFLLSQPAITTLSVGAAHPAELDWPLAIADQTGPLLPTEQAILTRLPQQAAAKLGTTQCHQCYACLPCPEEIHIPEVLRLRNLAIAHDMTEFGRYRYRMFENAGHWFPGRKASRCTECGDCLPRCPSGLAIPDLLSDAHQRFQDSPRPRLWETI